MRKLRRQRTGRIIGASVNGYSRSTLKLRVKTMLPRNMRDRFDDTRWFKKTLKGRNLYLEYKLPVTITKASIISTAAIILRILWQLFLFNILFNILFYCYLDN